MHPQGVSLEICDVVQSYLMKMKLILPKMRTHQRKGIQEGSKLKLEAAVGKQKNLQLKIVMVLITEVIVMIVTVK